MSTLWEQTAEQYGHKVASVTRAMLRTINAPEDDLHWNVALQSALNFIASMQAHFPTAENP